MVNVAIKRESFINSINALIFSGNTSTLDVLIHGGNSVGMLLELLIVRHPFYFFHFIYTIAVGLLYLMFMIAYYFLGGVDAVGNNYIYGVLNWEHPDKASLVALGILVLTIFLHIMTCIIQKLRYRVYKKVFKTTSLTINKSVQGTV